MDSSEEITDDILSYLLDNTKESDSSFVNDKSGNFSDVSFLTDTNPLIEPASPSVKSAFSSKKLEWDSSADVGCLPGRRTGFQLSTIERMALSNSASKLCFDEDDHSQGLLTKIDMLLGRSKRRKNILQTLPIWPSVNSSNCSEDTVIPVVNEPEPNLNQNLEFDCEIQGIKNKISSSAMSNRPASNTMCNPGNDLQQNSYSQRTMSSSRSTSFPTQRSLTKCDELNLQSVAVENSDSTINSLSVRSSKSVKQIFVSGSKEALCECGDENATADGSKSQCESNQSLALRETNHRQKQVMGELQVYRGLKEHLQNLKEYVVQLENTWKFLDQTQSRTAGSFSSGRHSKSRNHRAENIQRNTADSQTSTSSYRSSSVRKSSSMNTIASKSDRSFDIEPLNLQNSDNDCDLAKSKKRSKPKQTKYKCCSHCSLKTKPSQSTYRSQSAGKQMETNDMSVQVEDQQIISVEPVAEAEREPVAYDIPLHSKPHETRRNLQDALKAKRPDFFVRSEMRRKVIKDMARLRLVDKVDVNSIPRIFTYQQSRQNTEKLYRQLPEAKNRNRSIDHKAMVNSNRIKAADFQKVMALLLFFLIFQAL